MMDYILFWLAHGFADFAMLAITIIAFVCGMVFIDWLKGGK